MSITTLQILYAKYGLFFRYGVAGVVGATVQVSILYIWVSLLGFESTYLLGVIMGFCVALVITFLLQKHWTYRDHSTHRTTKQFFTYGGVALLNLTANALLMAGTKWFLTGLGIDFFQGWYLLAQIVVVFLTSVMSFILNYFITFRRASVSESEIADDLGNTAYVPSAQNRAF
jgi:putative flippase GtrA